MTRSPRDASRYVVSLSLTLGLPLPFTNSRSAYPSLPPTPTNRAPERMEAQGVRLQWCSSKAVNSNNNSNCRLL